MLNVWFSFCCSNRKEEIKHNEGVEQENVHKFLFKQFLVLCVSLYFGCLGEFWENGTIITVQGIGSNQ